MNLPDDQRAFAARAKILSQFGISVPAAAPTQADNEQRFAAARTKIANQFGISKRTVENQITHALKHLRLSYRDLSEMVLFVLLIIKL